MKTASRITLTLAAVTTLAAIWQPFGGTWWQFLATAILLLLIGAGTGATADKPHEHTQSRAIPLHDGEIITGTGDPELDKAINTRPTYGRKADEK